MTEEWRNVVGFEGLYQVSDLGRVKRLDHHRDGRHLCEKILKATPTGDGHLQVGLGADGAKVRKFTVHSLVLLAFVGPRPFGAQGRHLDDDPANNRLDNLAWGTPKDNAADRGKNNPGYHRSPSRRLEIAEAISLQPDMSYAEMAELGERFGVCAKTVRRTRDAWQAGKISLGAKV
jgi:hypothetical protein